MDPPAEIEQYSNRPSNTGQSSPTLSTYQLESVATEYGVAYISLVLLRIAERSLDLYDVRNQHIRLYGIVTSPSL